MMVGMALMKQLDCYQPDAHQLREGAASEIDDGAAAGTLLLQEQKVGQVDRW